ncbi:MAG TPA: hypothetical protein VGM96_14480 [Reyranella sp.]|jgi:hypothetical protein
MAVALAFAALIAIIAFAFFLMWGMPSILRGHHGDGESVGGPTTYAGHDSNSHSDGGSHGGSDGGGSSH